MNGPSKRARQTIAFLSATLKESGSRGKTERAWAGERIHATTGEGRGAPCMGSGTSGRGKGRAESGVTI